MRSRTNLGLRRSLAIDEVSLKASFSSLAVLVAELRGHEEFINLHTRVHVLQCVHLGFLFCWGLDIRLGSSAFDRKCSFF